MRNLKDWRITLTAIAANGIFGSGSFSVSILGHRFERLNYASACALYESCSNDINRSLTDDNRCELIRRSWGFNQS